MEETDSRLNLGLRRLEEPVFLVGYFIKKMSVPPTWRPQNKLFVCFLFNLIYSNFSIFNEGMNRWSQSKKILLSKRKWKIDLSHAFTFFDQPSVPHGCTAWLLRVYTNCTFPSFYQSIKKQNKHTTTKISIGKLDITFIPFLVSVTLL